MNTIVETLPRRFAAVLVTCLVAGSALPGQAAEPLLGPGDTVRVTVFDDPSLTTESRLSLQGTLAFPLLGEVAISDRTRTDAAKLISDRLKQGRFLQDPRVSVALVEVLSRRVMVMGHVVKPGQYALDGTNERMIDILA